MKVIIVRHAQTTENANTQDLGYDGAALLTEEGILQAKKLGHALKHEKISHAYVSPHKRAVHTAEEILAHHPQVKMVHESNLKEQSLGIHEKDPKHVWKKVQKEAKEPWHLFQPEKGESYAQLQARAATFFDQLLKKHEADDTVLIVSHGGTVGMLLLHILQKEITQENYKAYKPKNTAVTMLVISENGKIDVKTINSLEHLIDINEQI